MRFADMFTTARLILAPIFILSFLFLDKYTSLAILIIASITDALDGYAARREKKKWKYGKFYDAIVDKIFVLCIIAAFLVKGAIVINEAAMIVSRSIIVVFGLIMFYIIVKDRKKLVLPASKLGKITTTVQFLLLIAITLGLPYIESGIYFVFILGVFTGLGYVVEWKKIVG